MRKIIIRKYTVPLANCINEGCNLGYEDGGKFLTLRLAIDEKSGTLYLRSAKLINSTEKVWKTTALRIVEVLRGSFTIDDEGVPRDETL